MASGYSFDVDDATGSGNGLDGSVAEPSAERDGTDPATIDGTGPEPGTVRKRKRRSDAGQPRGTRSKAASGATLDLSAYVGIWAGLHAHAAAMMQTPEMAITESEAGTFLQSAQNVMRHYPVSASQKALDWAAFAFVASTMYIPRFMAIGKRRQRAKREAAQENANVTPVFPHGFQHAAE